MLNFCEIAALEGAAIFFGINLGIFVLARLI
jgi:hypothetical protein